MEGIGESEEMIGEGNRDGENIPRSACRKQESDDNVNMKREEVTDGDGEWWSMRQSVKDEEERSLMDGWKGSE